MNNKRHNTHLGNVFVLCPLSQSQRWGIERVDSCFGACRTSLAPDKNLQELKTEFQLSFICAVLFGIRDSVCCQGGVSMH